MNSRIVFLRVLTRFLVAMTVSMAILAVLLTLVLYSDNLNAIGNAGWAVIGSLGTFLGQALVAISRAMSQNPSGRGQLTEEDS